MDKLDAKLEVQSFVSNHHLEKVQELETQIDNLVADGNKSEIEAIIEANIRSAHNNEGVFLETLDDFRTHDSGVDTAKAKM